MNELKTIASNIPLLPEWAKVVVLNLFAIYVILQLLHLILKKLQTPELRHAISALKELSGDALRKAGQTLTLPVERPRIALVASALNAVLYYVSALIFFAWFGVFLFFSSNVPELDFLKRITGLLVAAGFIVASRWYYVSAERQRIALVEHWKTMRGGNDSNITAKAAAASASRCGMKHRAPHNALYLKR